MLLFTISKYIISKVLKDPKSENAGLRFNGILIKRNVFFYYLGELKKLFNK